MGLQDLIITPFYFFLLLIVAFIIRPLVTNQDTKIYFIPGLLIKFAGAISLGLIYQFYYRGGDTFTFHTHGSRLIWQAFMDHPFLAIKMWLNSGGEFQGDIFKYTSNIWLYRDEASYFVIKIASFFDILTGSTYSATALFFAAFAFSGHWVLFSTFQRFYPDQTKYLAIACLFVPSVIFWGSGILKDSITLSALCWMTYALFQITIWKSNPIRNMFLLVFLGWILFSIKIYILLCFLAATSIFLYSRFSSLINSVLIRTFLKPFLMVIFLGLGYIVLKQISQSDSRYALDKIAHTAMVTAHDIRYGWGARDGDNSGYTLGNLDGSFSSFLGLAPKGVIVTLFRPWPWEVKNPLMLLAATESLIILVFSIFMFFGAIINSPKKLWVKLNDPIVLYCLTFSLLFAFAVGVSTYNFGTLMRYKIPVIPFYLITLIIAKTVRR